VTRTQRIGTPPLPGAPDNTPATNSAYQQLLAAAAPGSPWQYYQLVMTQWPTPGSTPANPGSPNFTIPGSTKTTPVLSSFSNVTMETFDQGSIFTGCMNCHNAAAHPGGDDFLWSLAVNAYPPASGTGLLATARSRFKPSTLAALRSLAALKHREFTQNNAKAKALAPTKR